MPEDSFAPQPVDRITCTVHSLLGEAVTDRLLSLGVKSVLAGNARGVRQRVRSRGWWLPGQTTELDDSPMDVFRVTVPREASPGIAGALIDAGHLRTPGHGMLYVQEVTDYNPDEAPAPLTNATQPSSGILRDMALLTCILSRDADGDALARVALSLGAGVPVISRGMGTGIRDQLGLLRITIPPEKAMVRLLVPAHDAENLRCILIEEGRLDRPGGGFLYQTPVREGLTDPLLRIGRQQHAASMEQIIATLDEIKGSTAWRQRFTPLDERPEQVVCRTRRRYLEITFTCREGRADAWVRAAMEAGAAGGTTAQAQSMVAKDLEAGGAARETGIFCVPVETRDSVLKALLTLLVTDGDAGSGLQTLDVPAVFAHQRG